MKKIIIAVLLVAGLAFMTACGSVKDAAEDAGDEAGKLADNVRDGAENLADDVKDGAADLGDNIQDGVENLTDQSGSTVESVASDERMNSDELARQLDLTGNALIDVTADNPNKLNYHITLIGEDIESDTGALSERAQMAENTFEDKVKELKDKGVDNPEVIVTFFNEDGQSLYSKTYQ